MPLVKIITNVPKSKIPVDFLERFTVVIATSIGKPYEVINFILNYL